MLRRAFVLRAALCDGAIEQPPEVLVVYPAAHVQVDVPSDWGVRVLGEGHFESGTHTPAAVLEWQVASAEVRLQGDATTHGEVTVGARARAGRSGSTDTYRLGVDRARVADCVVLKGGLE